MGQFKPMVKMETTEPSVVLKLKKGGHVNMKKGGKAESGHKKMAMGGAMDELATTPAFVGRPAVNAPVKAPGKPSMAMRRKAMMAKKPPMPAPNGIMPPMAPPPMKKGGKAEGGMESKADERKEDKMDMAQDKAIIKKAFKQHDAQEHKGGKGTKLTLKKGGKATGGVAMSNAGGFKVGGEIDSKKSKTKMVTAKKMATGGVALSNAGGFATGGVAMSNAGGFKKGGSTKKGYAAGGKVDSGRPVAMPQGQKKAPAPATQVTLSGVYKKGGKVAKKAIGGAMAPRFVQSSANRPAQTISVAPIGSSQADRDFFASRGKRYKDGGNVQKKAFGGAMMPKAATPLRQITAPPPRPVSPRTFVDPVAPRPPMPINFDLIKNGIGKAGSAIGSALDQGKPPTGNRLEQMPAMDPRMMAVYQNNAGPAKPYKKGGNVSSKSLYSTFKSENAPEMRDSKKDDNLGYDGGNATKVSKFK